MKMKTTMNSIPDRSPPGSRTALPVSYQGGGDKYATDTTGKLRARNNISIGTWNTRTLADHDGKIEELVHEMTRYRWNLLGLCETRWKNKGEITTMDGHKLFYSGHKQFHIEGVGFLVHKDYVNTVIECKQISSRLISLRLNASPFNITVVQAYAPTTTYSDEEVEDFYTELQKVIDQVPQKDILLVQGDWNAKVGKDAQSIWKDTYGPSCNDKTNERGHRLLEFATTNKLILANTLGNHKASRTWTWLSPNGSHHQIDYIMVPKRFRNGVNIARTRTFPGADIGSDHDLVMMSFRVHLKNLRKPKFTRPRFNLEKLKDPAIKDEFQAMIGGKFAALTLLDGESFDMEPAMEAFNSAIIETASEVLGKYQRPKKSWVTADILELCDKRRELKKEKENLDGAKKYREANKKVRREMKKAKENWVEQQCAEIENNLRKNNTKKAYQVVKDLTKDKQERPSGIQSKSGECLNEENDILNRWTEYCSDLYNYQITGDKEVLNCPIPKPTDEEPPPILRSEVEAAVKSLKLGKSAGIDNIPSELVEAGGEAMITALTTICNKIWKDGTWPNIWTQSLIITIPKKGNLQQCNNYRTISLICHPSKVMLRILLNRLRPIAETIIAEEQAGFRAGRSTGEQIFNLRMLCEKYLEHQQDLYHVFIDFKKAFDRVWHEALWITMRKYNINANLVQIIEQLYSKATSAVFLNGRHGEWFRTTVGVRQGCLLSPTLFNIFLERIMEEALENHKGTVSIGGRTITNLRFADDIDGIAGSEKELKELVKQLDMTASAFGMEISAEKTKMMTNNIHGISSDIRVSGTALETVEEFKYLGSIISDKGSRPEILARIAQTTSTMTKLKTIWKDKNISLRSKIRLMRSLALSIFLYACETWTLTAELEQKILSTETRCYRRLLGISYEDHVTNIEVIRRITEEIGPHDNLLTVVKKRKLKWYGHTTRSNGLAKTTMQGTVNGGRKKGRPRKKWLDNIKEWTGLSFEDAMRMTEDREEWRRMVATSSLVTQRPIGVTG